MWKNRAYPAFVGGCALVAFLVVFNSGELPSPARLIGASNELASDRPVPAHTYYPNCDAARSAGVAPIRVGEPGYRPQLDRDNDGIACEPYFGS
jgi:hypothetical protein